MQQLNPLAVPHVGLAARNVAQLPGVDQQDLDAAGLQQFVEGNPVNVGALHRHRFHPLLQQPLGQLLQLRHGGAEGAHVRRPFAHLRSAHPVLPTPQVDPRYLGVYPRQGCQTATLPLRALLRLPVDFLAPVHEIGLLKGDGSGPSRLVVRILVLRRAFRKASLLNDGLLGPRLTLGHGAPMSKRGVAAGASPGAYSVTMPLFHSRLIRPARRGRCLPETNAGEPQRPKKEIHEDTVRRGKAPSSSGCESRPTTVAPVGSSQGGSWR